MPVTPTYPGIYVEEILSSSHTITAAPTSVTVFVGYTHPFKTKPQHYGAAVQLFSFSDYEREFGGLFSVDWLTDDVGRAVFQFFANGGAIAWVVALQPQLHPFGGGAPTPVLPPSLTLGTATVGITFTGREPVDASHALTVSLTNLKDSTTPGTFDIADVTVGYASRSEAISKMISEQLVQHQQQLGRQIMAGTITLIYDHAKNGLQGRLMRIQHKYLKEIISSQHVHLEQQHSLEVLLVQGPGFRLKRIADALITCRGVKHGYLNVTSTILPPIY